jgi:hypothetical protein
VSTFLLYFRTKGEKKVSTLNMVNIDKNMTYMSNTYARCPMEKSKGHWTFHLSNGSNGPPIFHWTFACPFDPMDKWNVHWPAMDSM